MNETSTIRPASTISLRHLGHAADVLDAVGVGEAEVLVEPVADVVAVEQVGVAPIACSFFSTRLAMVDLPAPERPVNQSTPAAGPWRGARRLVDVERLPVDVLRAAQREVDHPGADGPLVIRSIRMKPPVSRFSA
jgi:hypothetical protein